MNKRTFFALLICTASFIGCATGEDKNEGTTEDPSSSVGTTFERNDPSRNTGTTTPGDTAGANTTPTNNDQVGPTGTGQGGSQ